MPSDQTETTAVRRKIWGRRQNRPLNTERSQAMNTVFPALQIDSKHFETPASLPPESLFSSPDNPIWLEIGFGQGEHVIGLLNQNQNINILGAEPFLNGMASFVKNLPESNQSRTRVIMDDAMLLVHSLTDNSISRIYVLNPTLHKNATINVALSTKTTLINLPVS